jgi:RNA recognition motif-containing protein
MSNILYVGNIPFGVEEKNIRELLGKIGRVVSMRLLTDRHAFQPKWSGFVEMSSEAEATKAIEALNGKMLRNEPITVLKQESGLPDSKPCPFCISKGTCKKPDGERVNNCKDYMLKIESERIRYA